MSIATTLRRFLNMARPFLPFNTKEPLSALLSKADLFAIHKRTTAALCAEGESSASFAWCFQYFSGEPFLVCYRVNEENRPDGDPLLFVDLHQALQENSIDSALEKLATYTTADA